MDAWRVTNDLNAKAERLRALHDSLLLLPNAWDPGSALLIAQAGASAIATTSGGVSWAHGRADGQHLTREQMAAAVRAIVDVVDLPVTADVEGGYGPTPDDVAATVRAVVDAGAVGINLEDSKPDGSLFDAEAQSERIRAGRAAAVEAGVPDLVINARTDVYLLGIGEPDGRAGDTEARAKAYAEAGANCLFVPGLLDLDALRQLVGAVSLPVNAMLVAGGPSVPDLAGVGVRRVSTGSMLTQAAYSAAGRLATELLTSGTHVTASDALGFQELNTAFGSGR